MFFVQLGSYRNTRKHNISCHGLDHIAGFIFDDEIKTVVAVAQMHTLPVTSCHRACFVFNRAEIKQRID